MTKEKILLATLKLASKEGLGNVSLSMIAEEVGIRKASLFAHYKSKREIIDSMYLYFRDKALSKQRNLTLDLEGLCKDKSLEEVLWALVLSYDEMNSDADLLDFYKLVMSERAFNKEAATVLVEDTRRMEKATEKVFAFLLEKGLAHFADIRSASILFAHGVHSLLDHSRDIAFLEGKDEKEELRLFVKEFSRLYR